MRGPAPVFCPMFPKEFSTNMLVGRFDGPGEVEPLIEIE
jgi:hypothetical protein